MIGKPEWFSTRKFGWGLGIKSWQGIAYIMVIAFLYSAVLASHLDNGMKTGALAVLSAIVIADMLHIMFTVYSHLDEREEKHELVAERNAAFTAIAVIVVYMIYQLFSVSLASGQPDFQVIALPAILLVAMSIVKGATLLLLEREG